MTDCVFCKIIEGQLPCRKLYEDDKVLAFWDIRPSAPVHVLVVPKAHIPTLNDVPDGDGLVSHMAAVARKVARQLGVDQSGYRFFFNVNKGGGQVVFHLHAHVIAGNDLGMFFIKAAVAFAMVWRWLVNRIQGR